jgi:hypothetical protein
MISVDKIEREPFVEWHCKELSDVFDNQLLIGEGSYGYLINK